MYLMKLLYKLRKTAWFFIRPMTKGARAIIIENNKVLLVKHSYQDQFFLPGGKVNKGETYDAGLIRELKEELNMDVQNLTYFGTYQNFFEYKDDTVLVFLVKGIIGTPRASLEIDAMQWFDIDQLPADISPGSKKRLLAYLVKHYPTYDKW